MDGILVHTEPSVFYAANLSDALQDTFIQLCEALENPITAAILGKSIIPVMVPTHHFIETLYGK